MTGGIIPDMNSFPDPPLKNKKNKKSTASKSKTKIAKKTAKKLGVKVIKPSKNIKKPEISQYDGMPLFTGNYVTFETVHTPKDYKHMSSQNPDFATELEKSFNDLKSKISTELPTVGLKIVGAGAVLQLFWILDVLFTGFAFRSLSIFAWVFVSYALKLLWDHEKKAVASE